MGYLEDELREPERLEIDYDRIPEALDTFEALLDIENMASVTVEDLTNAFSIVGGSLTPSEKKPSVLQGYHQGTRSFPTLYVAQGGERIHKPLDSKAVRDLKKIVKFPVGFS